MRKLILTCLLILFVPAFLFSANPLSGNLVYPGDADNPKTEASTSITYKFSTTGDSAINTYKVGFSTTPVTSLETDVSGDNLAQSEYTLTVANGEFEGKLPSDIYVFWQIASNVNCSISLKPTAMTGTKGGTLDIIFSTENSEGLSTGTTVTAYSAVDTETGLAPGSDSGDVLEDFTKEIVSYTANAETNNNQAYGSQKINITTHNISGLTADSYTGTLTVTITATGDAGV